MLTLAISSGKGGVGKTTVACNLAAALQQSGQQVVLFDADLQLANLDIVLGVEPAFNLQHVVAGDKTLQEIIVDGPSGVRAVTGASAVPCLMHAGPKRMATFLSQLADLEKSTDVLIFDTAAGLDNKVMTFMKLAQEVIVVVTPDPTSVTDAYATIKTVNRRVKGARVRVLFNLATEAEAQALFDTLEEICWKFLGKQIEFLGNINYDRNAHLASRKRQLYVLAQPESKASKDVRALAQVLRQSIPTKEEPATFLEPFEPIKREEAA